MKKWEFPQVGIDQFVANEYISSCTDEAIEDESKVRHLVRNGYSTEHIGLDINGSTGGWYDSENTMASDWKPEQIRQIGQYTQQWVYFIIDPSKVQTAKNMGLTVEEERGFLSPTVYWARVWGYKLKNGTSGWGWHLASSQTIAHNMSLLASADFSHSASVYFDQTQPS